MLTPPNGLAWAAIPSHSDATGPALKGLGTAISCSWGQGWLFKTVAGGWNKSEVCWGGTVSLLNGFPFAVPVASVAAAMRLSTWRELFMRGSRGVKLDAVVLCVFEADREVVVLLATEATKASVASACTWWTILSIPRRNRTSFSIWLNLSDTKFSTLTLIDRGISRIIDSPCRKLASIIVGLVVPS